MDENNVKKLLTILCRSKEEYTSKGKTWSRGTKLRLSKRDSKSLLCLIMRNRKKRSQR